jgi:hypothetical protein
MRKSRTISLLLLGGSLFSFSMCLCAGCGRQPTTTARAPYDPTWHDAEGKAIEKAFVTDESGKRRPAQPVFDVNGKPIQFDDNGNPIPPSGTRSTYSSSSSSYHRSSSGVFVWPWLLGRSPGYSSTPTYRSGPSSSGSTYFGGSKPSGSPSSSGAISRGGFGGSAASSSSS